MPLLEHNWLCTIHTAQDMLKYSVLIYM